MLGVIYGLFLYPQSNKITSTPLDVLNYMVLKYWCYNLMFKINLLNKLIFQFEDDYKMKKL